MASSPQILSDLKVIQDADQELELLTTYKGVPFICKTKIASIQGDIARLTTHDPTIICLEGNQQTKVLGSDYFEPSAAQIIAVDVTKGIIELSNFTYVGTKMGERMIVRVEPKEPIEVTLEQEGTKNSGSLADISISGAGVRVPHAIYNSALKPGASVQVSMELPKGSIRMVGIVLSVIKTEEFYRLSIRFSQDGSQKVTIFKYLIDRRAEIESELQSQYQLIAG